MEEQKTYTATCDACSYEATTQAADVDTAAYNLAEDLAAHNLEAHQQQTDVDAIIGPVKAKMQKAD
jgi:hypothetical protein